MCTSVYRPEIQVNMIFKINFQFISLGFSVTFIIMSIKVLTLVCKTVKSFFCCEHRSDL